MASDGRVVFEITGDNRHVNQVLRDTTADIEKESKKWDKAAAQTTDSMGSSFTSMFKTISAAAMAAKVGQVLMDWGKQAVQAASDLQEVQNVVDVTFGESGAAKIETWARNAGTQFGLTETQAKKFTSTLGAMMKSAGMAGPEIVSMSTDLAGLAADMASFYNLDFETAFQKIRSGISGETEPLKQLGINMSVANLQAYALTQGITKAFDKMSQSEQTMLRYQYLMQATADAQGDFARTSDGYANSLRMLETNIESLKTKLGNVLIPAISEAVGAINGMLESLMPDESKKTVLDQFDEINLDTAGKLTQIQNTAEEARVLIGVLEQIQGGVAAKNLNDVAESANSLNVGAGSRWERLIEALGKAGVIKTTFDNDMDAAEDNIWLLARTINGEAPADEKIKAWNSLLTILKDNAGALSAFTGKSVGDTQKWLEGMASGANGIDATKPDAWVTLMGALADGLPGLTLDASVSENMSSVASAANELNSGVGSRWKSVLNALKNADDLKSVFGDSSTIPDKIRAFATAITFNAPGTDTVTAWQGILGALSDNAEGLTALTGTTAGETKEWLEKLAEGANAIDPADADAWATLFDTLLHGLPGLEDSEAGKALLESLSGGSSQAAGYLEALGIETDAITDKQKMWLETCRQLVQTIPGLNEIINTETGEVEGGVDAIKAYVDEWQKGQEKILAWKAYYAKEDALNEKRASEYMYQLDMITAEQRVKRLRDKFNQLGGVDAFNAVWQQESIGQYSSKRGWFAKPTEEDQALLAAYRELIDAEAELSEATEDYNKQVEANSAAVQYLQDAHDGLIATYGAEESAASNAANATASLTDAQTEAAQTAIQQLAPALEALADYYESTRQATAQTVESTVSGFKKIVTPAEEARKKVSDLTKELEKAENKGEIQLKIADAESAIPSVQNMTAALKDQLEYINEYQKNLDEARRRGVSEELLAALSDGSVESADYLAALATASGKEITELNKAYADVQKGKETFTDALAAQKLAADETFDGIVAKANEMITELDMADGAKNALTSTVEGMALGIAAAVPDIATQVDAVISQLERLSAFGGFSFSGGALTFGGSGGGMDYGLLGDTIRANTSKTAGNVYLDGKAVGGVIERVMANDYTTMSRSGWNNP